MPKKNEKKIKLTLTKSLNGRLKKHLACIRGLGLHRIHETVEVSDGPCVRGMINKVNYLLKVEE